MVFNCDSNMLGHIINMLRQAASALRCMQACTAALHMAIKQLMRMYVLGVATAQA
jgi:hypothetical protein